MPRREQRMSALALEKFNHLIIKAGESVSFNKVAGKRTVANGYQQALEIAYGNYVLGTGGGICQVSSTLYNAVVNAGLTVNKRTPHAIPSSYVEKGLDATVSDDRYDFVFTNNTNSDIYIETEFVKVKGYYHSRFTIYGRPDPNGYTYKLVSQVVETIPCLSRPTKRTRPASMSSTTTKPPSRAADAKAISSMSIWSRWTAKDLKFPAKRSIPIPIRQAHPFTGSASTRMKRPSPKGLNPLIDIT